MHAAETMSDHAALAEKRKAAAITQLLIISLVTFGKHSSVVSHSRDTVCHVASYE